MSTEPYPDVTGDDESGIVPPQSGRSGEWPKKIRTLTAAELDRLTIDSAGRFYWDGKLVNYEPPERKEHEGGSSESTERSAMDIIDRAVHDLNEHQSPEPIEGAALPRPVDTHARSDEYREFDFDIPRSQAAASSGGELVHAAAPAVQMIRASERVRLSMSRWQCFGAVILVIAVALGATGVAAYGWVVAHDWGCRTGLIESYCPAQQSPRVRPRLDIPA